MFFRKARAAQGDEAVHSPFGSTTLNTAQAQEDHSMSNPGPQNLGLVRLNPNSNRPPPTDQGSVGSIWHSFDMTHRRVQEGGWSHQVNIGEDDLLFLELFAFPGFEEISLNSWLRSMPVQVAVAHTNLPPEEIAGIPPKANKLVG
jgi:hypothetical protein